MYVCLFVISLVAGSALSSPLTNNQLKQTKHEQNKIYPWADEPFYWETIKRTDGLPIPKMTKNMEPSEWFELYEILHPYGKDDYDFKVSLNYYLDEAVVECNLAALKLPYENLKKAFKRC